MNRRGFLKSALGVAASSLVPVSLLASGYKEPASVATVKGNNFDSEFTKKLMSSFLDKFEENRALSKTLNCNSLSYSKNNTITIKRHKEYRLNE